MDQVTLLGTAGEILLGVVGLDLPLDIRDLFYDVTHFEFSPKWAGMFALDVVSVLPVVGVLKYSDEAIKIGKRWAKSLGKTSKATADVISIGAKKLKKYIDIAGMVQPKPYQH